MLRGDEEKILWLFENYSGYRIAKESGISQSIIARLINGTRELKNISFEAEVGTIGGEEDGVVGNGELADPKEAKAMQELGIDFLAAGVGNIHGPYPANWKGLSFAQIELLSKETANFPLVLHGGTGIPEDQVKKAIKLGIAKINVNTELQQAFRDGLHEYFKAGLDQVGKGYDPRKILKPGVERAKEIVRQKMQFFGSVGKC